MSTQEPAEDLSLIAKGIGAGLPLSSLSSELRVSIDQIEDLDLCLRVRGWQLVGADSTGVAWCWPPSQSAYLSGNDEGRSEAAVILVPLEFHGCRIEVITALAGSHTGEFERHDPEGLLDRLQGIEAHRYVPQHA